MGSDLLTLALGGDVMLGRGVDQILPHPGDPELCEPYVGDAREYVMLAEEASGAIPQPVGFDWPWGDALRVLREAAPDVWVVNLETGVTRSGDFAPDKSVHYRMNPENLPGLLAARPDVCVLANNHVLDFGERGLVETLDVLAGAGVRAAGAGRDEEEAWRPAIVEAGAGRRVLVFAFGMPSSGIPPGWAARPGRPGVAYVPAPSPGRAAEVGERVRRAKRPGDAGDTVVASVHWGSNWGYEVPRDHIQFAHILIDSGVDVVHGHSSHHPRPIERYRNGLVLYGCGDLIDDYEGIPGYEEYRDELRLLYLVTLGDEAPARLRMVPLRARRMRLERAGRGDAEWLAAMLDRTGRRLGSRVGLGADGMLALRAG
ncbi:putative polyglutamine synthesis accessory protein [Thermopolyspora flexuosa]|uniref:Poly-gamma-glutamate synthesis protein (Capsule biosynthesis protein) n=1 Tax=Thermopolyspora flexuosa TaxID=103836 RepID=A0A543IQ92_9ACTN|nr:CapA family protein [Thermopolyspora flexuosa]TQM72751.1 poly-gamma-glutamate synthesis protein (capsule biosynthesis protein) [Thermopolyspora flexuosa]GGM68196.1 putative polyglutamine synthesis accessory protein [Thermopolyspora flexuosa]